MYRVEQVHFPRFLCLVSISHSSRTIHSLPNFSLTISDIFMSAVTTNPVADRRPVTPGGTQGGQLVSQAINWQSKAREAIRRLPSVLTAKEISRLREHRYASEGTTLLDPWMQHFWKWLVEYCPLWVAPNLLTIIGLVINIATSVLLLIYTKGATEQVQSLSLRNQIEW